MSKPKDVESYIVAAPPEIQAKLRQLRSAIREAEPEAIERISYDMPYYEYRGRLAYFRLAKRHISLFIPTPIIDEHRDDLAGYHAVQATIHLPLDQDLPIALIQKLVKARAKKNEEVRATTS